MRKSEREREMDGGRMNQREGGRVRERGRKGERVAKSDMI